MGSEGVIQLSVEFHSGRTQLIPSQVAVDSDGREDDQPEGDHHVQGHV